MSKFDSKIYERDIYQDSVYSAWLKYSSERDVLEKVFREIADEWCDKDSLSILDIGCGTGSAAQRVFKILDEKQISYKYTGVDPYQDQLTRFREAFPDETNIKFIASKIEDLKTDNRFDLVMIVHALYYVDSLEETLKNILPLADKLVIVHHGKHGINEVHEAFRKYVKEGPNIISTYQNVASALDHLKITYDLKIYDTYVDVSSCKDSNNEDGRKLIKFFLEHSTLPESTFEEVSNWFKTKSDSMKHDVGYFFISK